MSLSSSMIRVALASTGLLAAVLSMGAQGLCGCPSTCSPLNCVKILDCDWEQPDTSVCRWRKCGGKKWETPGPFQVTQTGWMTYQCVTRDGRWHQGVCVPNQVGDNPVEEVVEGASVISTTPCQEEPNDP
jgi:hypothetical protein